MCPSEELDSDHAPLDGGALQHRLGALRVGQLLEAHLGDSRRDHLATLGLAQLLEPVIDDLPGVVERELKGSRVKG